MCQVGHSGSCRTTTNTGAIMTVQELITELQQIEDKNLPVYTYNSDSGCGGEVCGAAVTTTESYDEGAFERLPHGTKVVKIYED